MLYLLLITTLAGLATVLGGLIAAMKKPSDRFLGVSLGFASGVMLIVSFLNLVSKSFELGPQYLAIIGFTAGAIFIVILDAILPHREFYYRERGKEIKLRWIGLLLALGIALHNIPEGVAMGAGYTVLPSFGLLIAIAIGLHNIPEGIATAVPLRAGGASTKEILKITLFSGLTEPFAAVLIATIFATVTPTILGAALAFAGGVMAYLACEELIPTAHKYGGRHGAAIGLIMGFVFMLILSALL